MDLLDRVAAARVGGSAVGKRSSIDQWLTEYLLPAVGQFAYGGNTYPYGLNQTLAGNRAEEISQTLPGFSAALRRCPPAFAAQMVRALVLSQARFTFRNLPWTDTPRRVFGNRDLGVLERPWPNATTGELLARMEWHEGLAGNAYVTNRQRGRLRVLRPDWVTVIYGSEQEPEDAAHALDGELLGYSYVNGGPLANRNRPTILLPEEVAHWCADEETEILTANGWKDFEALGAGDETLTLNHETGLAEWQPVLDVLVFPAQSREMVLMEGREFSSLTTPNHRWPVEYRISRARTYGRRWVTSGTIGAGDRIPVAAYSADVPLEQKWTDALVETVAWFWTEGRYKSGRQPGTKGRGIEIAQSAKNADHLARIRAALTALFGASVEAIPRRGPRADQDKCWRESVDDDMVIFRLSANASDAITEHAPGKVVTTGFIRSLTASQLDLFIKVSLLADNNGRNRLGQKNKAMAEQFGLACILAGRGVSIREGCAKKRGYRMTNVRILGKRHVYPQESGRDGAAFRVQRVTYDGHVWCPRTANQTWLARRRGSIYFTGNSPLPDPLNAGIGMSWITPAMRDIQGDGLATEHKVRFFENGAAQPYDAEVLTPTGWTRMEDISVGDYVTGPDGKPRRVIGVYPQGEKDIYRLTFKGGATTECCEDHLWQVTSHYDRKLGTHRVMPLREILDRGVRYPSGPAKWAVPLTDPVEYADADPLPLDAYLLGLLLGDGCFRSNGRGSGGVTLAAGLADVGETKELVRPLLPAGVTIVRRDSENARGRSSELYFKGPHAVERGPRGRITSHRGNPLTRIVRDLGLFDVPGPEKTIPQPYMHAAVNDRVSLLQGLIDSDGHVNHSQGAATGVTFTSTSETLAQQVRQLAQSLGGVASIKPESRNGQPGRRPQWRVRITQLPEWIVPVRLSRKRDVYRGIIRSGYHRGQILQSVELVRRAPAQCIKVDAEDGLYVTDDFIVTHNTVNLVVKGIPATTKEQFDDIVDMLEERHAGVRNAYRTLYLTAGADATVVGSDFQQMDFANVQGRGETRVSVLSRVPAPLLGISEGLAGSSLNAGNFGMARRMFADTWVYPTLQDVAAALAPLMNVPADAELWFDTADVPLLREDAKDAAEIEQIKASTIANLVKEGFTAESAVAAVMGQNMSLLVHTNLVSVQLQPPGVTQPNGKQPALPKGAS